ncbi:MAG: Histidinol-phosphate aminotransferase [Phycisphaerae bacterium]|nr:Histidinol-phosphate aminotransferase [Phycisphaerae bacterium]
MSELKPFRPHIADLAAYAPGEQLNAPDVIKLNTNENPYPPSPRVMEVLRTLDPLKLRRYPQPLADDFRAAAADVFGVRPDGVLAGNGSDDLLTMIARATLGPGDAAVAPYPSYTLYQTLCEIQAARMTWIDWPADFSLPTDALVAAGARVCFLANPNAQTGTLVQPAEVARLASRFAGLVVVDEAYVDFAGDGATSLPLLADHDNVLILRTLSKGYGLAGLRFGFAMAAPAVVTALAKVKDSYNCDAVSIAAATAAVRDQAYRRQTAAKVIAERGRLAGELRRRGWDVPDSRANFLLARPPGGRSPRAIYEALKARNILVRYFNQRRLDDRLRITVGTPADDDSLLKTLDETP